MRLNDNNNIFFISDFHLGHKNVIRFDNRPFKDLEEMHSTILNNWNKKVPNNGIVFYLGDLFYKSAIKYPKWFVHQLNGTIHFVLGNHDRFEDIRKMERFATISTEIKLDVLDNNKYQHIHMHHHPILSWNKAPHGSIHLHGHVHQKMSNNTFYDWYYNRRVIDVGCNGHNYTPISYLEIIDMLKNKESKSE